MRFHKSAVSVAAAACLYSGWTVADVPVEATLCNHTEKPVEFRLYNNNDIAAGALPLVTKAVQPCSCVKKQTHTDMWHNFPPANIRQLVYRDVGATKGTDVKVCVDAKGKFKGYIDGKVSSCVEASNEVKYLPAPELTGAQGDLEMLETRLMGEKTGCSEDWTKGCKDYQVRYEFIDGSQCHGNDS